jgi:hypothetical protein
MRDVVGTFVFCILLGINLTGQTCCSGGVPVSSNLGFGADEVKTLQLSFTTDFNVLKSLYSGGEQLTDGLRKRTTQSYLLRAAYGFANRWTVESSFSLVRQTRRIYGSNNNVDQQSTFGIGDPVVLLIYDVLQGPINIRLGVGPQIPLARTDFLSDRGLFLVEDLQPGSGAWDAIFFTSATIQSRTRPTNSIFFNAIYSGTGVNPDSRGGLQSYEFGNDLQIVTGVSDQFLWFNQIFSPSLGLRFRTAQRDVLDGFDNSGTGGTFLFLRSGLGLSLRDDYRIDLTGEIPLFTQVNETQLATTYTLNISLYKRFSFSKNEIFQPITF